jgi:hypothetical protein
MRGYNTPTPCESVGAQPLQLTAHTHRVAEAPRRSNKRHVAAGGAPSLGDEFKKKKTTIKRETVKKRNSPCRKGPLSKQ